MRRWLVRVAGPGLGIFPARQSRHQINSPRSTRRQSSLVAHGDPRRIEESPLETLPGVAVRRRTCCPDDEPKSSHGAKILKDCDTEECGPDLALPRHICPAPPTERPSQY
jgi:hypothetical protein